MSLALDSAAQAQIDSRVAGVHWLVQMDFATPGTQYLTTAPLNVVVGGKTYVGLSQLLTIANVQESESGSTDKLALRVPVVNAALLAATMGSIENYRGRAVRLYLQVFSAAFVPVGAPKLRWSGYMQPVKISRTRDANGKQGGTIEMPCTRAGSDRSRNALGARLTDAQQKQAYPGDQGCEYIQPLMEQPALWLSKKFLLQ